MNIPIGIVAVLVLRGWRLDDFGFRITSVGSLAGLLLYAAAPWLLASLARASGVEPYVVAGRPRTPARPGPVSTAPARDRAAA